jgi:long-chain acyl-CoA synthetase
MTSPVDVLGAPDPVAAVLTAHAEGTPIAVRTSGTTSSPRLVVRSTASWVDSFPAVTALTGLDAGSRLWLPGPLHASMNLFAAVHARSVGAEVLDRPDGAGHAVLTPAALATALAAGTPLAGMHLVVAGDRLPRALADRAVAAGARTAHYYGAAELSFLAWGTAEDDLRAFPGVELAVRDGVVWARSPYASTGYAAGQDGPLRTAPDGWATVGDRGTLTADRVLLVAGRGTDAVTTAGATVLVAEVEQALRRAGSGDVVVVGVPHPRLGQLVAAVGTDAPALAAARAGASELTAAQRPRLWLHVERWPLTAAGKVDRAAVAELAASGHLAHLPAAVA